MSVILRKRKLKNNKLSLYLDINNNGRRYTEFLGIKMSTNDRNKKNLMEIAETKRAITSELEIKNIIKLNIIVVEYNKIVYIKDNQDFFKWEGRILPTLDYFTVYPSLVLLLKPLLVVSLMVLAHSLKIKVFHQFSYFHYMILFSFWLE